MVSRRLGLAATLAVALLASTPLLAEDFDGGFSPGHFDAGQFDSGNFAVGGGNDGDHDGHRHHHRHHGRWHRDYPLNGGYGLPSIIPGLGTYAGAISAERVKGNGIYFYVDGLGDGGVEPVRPNPSAKVIKVEKNTSACAFEAGVCVIRP
nr:hypothetical protein [uncultured Gellertiella sp.]